MLSLLSEAQRQRAACLPEAACWAPACCCTGAAAACQRCLHGSDLQHVDCFGACSATHAPPCCMQSILLTAVGAAGVFMQAVGLRCVAHLLGETNLLRIGLLCYGLEEVFP